MLQNLKDRYDKLRDDYPIDTPSALLGVENSIRSVTTIMSNGVLQNWTRVTD